MLSWGWVIAVHITSPQREFLWEARGENLVPPYLSVLASQVSDKPELLHSQGGTWGLSAFFQRVSLPGLPRGTAWSEDIEVNTDCSGPLRSTASSLGCWSFLAPRTCPGSSTLRKSSLHLVLNPVCPGKQSNTQPFYSNGKEASLIHNVHLILLHKHTSLL